MTCPQPLPEAARETPLATILLVEDDTLLRSIMAEFLRLEGFHVLEAGDVAEGKRVLAADQKIELLLTDIRMPGNETGIDLAAHVQTHHPGVPILIISSSFQNFDLRKWRFLNKPFQLEQLLSVVRTLLFQQT